MVAGDGDCHYEFMDRTVGNAGMSTCVLGSAVRGAAPRFRETHNDNVELVVRANMPSERIMLDQIVHKDLLAGASPELAVYSELTGETPSLALSDLRQEVPVFESVAALGHGPAALHAPSIPRYTQIIQYAAGRMGWDLRDFVVHRAELMYPPIPSAVVLSTPLPERQS